MDVMGPNQAESLGVKKYIIVIVNDFSIFTWVIFLREKSKTFQLIKFFFKRLQMEKTLFFKNP